MQSALLQGDPRLQKAFVSPHVAAAIADPCIFYLEAKLSGDLPLLVACLAQNATEIKQPGGEWHWFLTNCRTVQNNAFAKDARENLWQIHGRREKSIRIIRSADGSQVRCSYISENFESAPDPTFRYAFRFIKGTLGGSQYGALSNIRNDVSLMRFIFLDSNLDWPSIPALIAGTRTKRRSLVDKVSSIFKKRKKPKFTHA